MSYAREVNEVFYIWIVWTRVWTGSTVSSNIHILLYPSGWFKWCEQNLKKKKRVGEKSKPVLPYVMEAYVHNAPGSFIIWTASWQIETEVLVLHKFLWNSFFSPACSIYSMPSSGRGRRRSVKSRQIFLRIKFGAGFRYASSFNPPASFS